MEEAREESVESRLGDCEVCGSNSAVYTCPRCEVKTCSLSCVTVHKKELDCNGERDKTGYVPLSKFNNLTLLSDYRFLEDITRAVDNCRRNPLKKFTRFQRSLPLHLWRLQMVASKRKTMLHFLPQHFTRHKENTTQLNFKSGVIHWKMDLIFPQGDNIKVVLDRCSEDDRLSAVLSQLLDFEKCPKLYRQHLRFYHACGLAGVEALLKAESVKTPNSFFVLDLSLTLKENFEDRIIIENPIIHVILRDHKDEYTILDPDLEVNCCVNNEMGPNDQNSFSRFHYFDSVSYSKGKERAAGDEAVQTISSSFAELKKYFAASDSDGMEDEEDESQNVQQSSKPKCNNSRNNRFKLNISSYDELVKQEV